MTSDRRRFQGPVVKELEHGVFLEHKAPLGKTPLSVRSVSVIFDGIRKLFIKVNVSRMACSKDQTRVCRDAMIGMADTEGYDPGIRRDLIDTAHQVTGDHGRKFIVGESAVVVPLVPVLPAPD